MKLLLSLLAISASTANAGVLSLTPENFDELTAGKTVFIKFFAPWCGHCKAMASDWEKLAGEWEGHDIGLIAEVDCTVEESRPLCDASGVQGFPTLKWGDPSALDDYEGGREYDEMADFAKENLKPVCSLANISLCDDTKKALINSLQAKSADELEADIAGAEKLMEEVEETFNAEVEKLQAKYEELTKEKEEKDAKIKDSGLPLMKAVLKSKTSGSDEL